MPPRCYHIELKFTWILECVRLRVPCPAQPIIRTGDMISPLRQVTQLVMTGEWSTAASRDALGLAMGACAQLDVVMRDALRASAEA